MTPSERYEKLIEGASMKASESNISYGMFTDGDFQIYAFPVQQRTVRRREHHRFTHYLRQGPNGTFYRTNKAEFMKRLEHETK